MLFGGRLEKSGAVSDAKITHTLNFKKLVSTFVGGPGERFNVSTMFSSAASESSGSAEVTLPRSTSSPQLVQLSAQRT